jgi:hypothetical protein
MEPDDARKPLREPLCGYDVYLVEGSRIAGGLSAQAAADLLEIDLFEFYWAMEQYGVCTTESHLALPSSREKPA